MNDLDLSREFIAGEIRRRGLEQQVERAKNSVDRILSVPIWYCSFSGGLNVKSADLSEARFFRTNASHSRFESCSFVDAQISEADFRNSGFVSSHLRDAIIQGDFEDSVFMDCTLEKVFAPETNFAKTAFGSSTLSSAEFSGSDLTEARFLDCKLHRTDLTGCNLSHVSCLRTSLHAIYLRDCRFDGTDFGIVDFDRLVGEEREARGEPGYIRESAWGGPATFSEIQRIYQLLKANYLSLGRFDEVAKLHALEKRAERLTYFPTTAGWKWIHTKVASTWIGRMADRVPISPLRKLAIGAVRGCFTIGLVLSPVRLKHVPLKHEPRINRLRWLFNVMSDQATGFGEKPSRTIRLGVFIMLVCALGFYFDTSLSIWNSLLMSLATFATFNLADPGLEPHGSTMNALASGEALAGVSLLALLVWTLGNRMRG